MCKWLDGFLAGWLIGNASACLADLHVADDGMQQDCSSSALVCSEVTCSYAETDVCTETVHAIGACEETCQCLHEDRNLHTSFTISMGCND